MHLGKKYPHLGFVGPMLGVNPGWVTSQGEILADLFTRAGYSVSLTSTQINRVRRVLDTAISLLTWKKQVDILLIMVFSGAGFGIADMASAIGRWMRKPIIMWLHGGALPQFSQRFPNWVQRVLSRGTTIVSPSPYLAHHFGTLGYSVRIIPNVLNLCDYPYRHRETCLPRLIWMRTFEESYNPELAVEVVFRLKSRWPGIVLTMGGQDRGWLNEVKRRIRKLNLEPNIRLVGFMDESIKKVEFSGHDIYLSTTRVDNTPVSVIEAAAFGLPIVATSVGGIPYMLRNEETALLVEDNNADEMALAISRLIDDSTLSSRLSEKGREMAETYDWKSVRLGWERLFSEMGIL